MATTNFSNGTVIEAAWLNDVDAHVYGDSAFSIVNYGAVGDNSTDNSAAILAALEAAKAAGGGTVLVPVGNFKFGTAITISNAKGIKLVGASASTQPDGGSQLIYTGTASAGLTFNACASTFVRGVGLRYTNAGFSGSLLAFANSAGVYVDNCSLMGKSVSGASYLIDLNPTTDVAIYNVALDFAQYGIRGQHENGTGFSNAVALSAIRFGDGLGACIRNPGQSWSIVGCDFEVASDDKGQGIKMSDAGVTAIGLSITGCWFGDATDAGAWAWIEFRGSGLLVSGNYIHGTGAFASTGVKIMAASTGITVTGNYIDSHLNGVDLSTFASEVLVYGNDFVTTTTHVAGTPAGNALLQQNTLALDIWSNGSRQLSINETTGLVSLNGTLEGGNIKANGIGAGFAADESANGKQGAIALIGGTRTVANTSVTATSRIFLTSNADGGTPGWVRVSSRIPGTSFTITSSSGTDTSTVAYEIFEVA